MSPGDRELAERDPELPGLAIAFDDDALTALLQERWPAGSTPPERAQVTYVRYKPGTLLLATVAVQVGRTRYTGLLAAAAAGASIAKLDKIVQHATRHQSDLPLIPHFERHLVFAPIEADRHLVGLDRLSDRITWIDRRLKGAELTVLSYKPHRRLVMRADVDGEPRATVKVHASHQMPEVAATLNWATSTRSDRLALPQLIGMDTDHGVVVTGWVPGAALDDVAPDRRRATLRSVGKLLGRLHRSDPSGLPPRGADATDPASFLTAIGPIRPDLVDRARRALRSPTPRAVRCTPVHGDLSADQVVHGPDGVALIDLDRTGVGDPAADLASWIAAEHLRSGSRASPLRVPPALLEGYRSVGGPASDADIAGQVPIELLRRATDPFRQRMPDWPQRMAALVHAAGASDALRTAS